MEWMIGHKFKKLIKLAQYNFIEYWNVIDFFNEILKQLHNWILKKSTFSIGSNSPFL